LLKNELDLAVGAGADPDGVAANEIELDSCFTTASPLINGGSKGRKTTLAGMGSRWGLFSIAAAGKSRKTWTNRAVLLVAFRVLAHQS